MAVDSFTAGADSGMLGGKMVEMGVKMGKQRSFAAREVLESLNPMLVDRKCFEFDESSGTSVSVSFST